MTEADTDRASGGTKAAAGETKPRKFGAVARELRERMHGKPALDPGDAEDGGRPPGACFCGGCPMTGSYDVGSSGRFFCQWHAYALPDAWGEITGELQRHQWLIDIIGKLQGLWRGGHSAAWRAMAATFFETRPELKPTPHELLNFGVYAWRLHETLGFLIGVRQHAPEPRKPAIEQPLYAQMRRAPDAPAVDLGAEAA